MWGLVSSELVWNTGVCKCEGGRAGVALKILGALHAAMQIVTAARKLAE